MQDKNIVFTDPTILLPKFINEIKAIPDVSVRMYDSFPVGDEELYVRGKDAEIIVIDVLTEYKESVLRRWPKLEAILTTSVGVNHIDVAYCEKNGIKVINFPGFNARAVAEMALANLISLLRGVPMASRNTMHGGWDYQFFEGEELAGKTMGIIGSGNVGSEMIKIGKGMSMHVMVNTKHPSKEKALNLGIDEFYTLEDVLKKSDFVILTIPANDETKNMISARALSKMKRTAYLINVARAQVVDPLALAEAIYTGEIAGAALDLIDKEPFNLNHADMRIQEMVNSYKVILTPHIAYNTRESAIRLGERIVKEMRNLVQ